ncbi:MAG: hypothetical protein NTW19_03725 [Planctomycetota bacterium]|nr:hypothetical protein [Planctomycetota bacterium]
MTNKAWMVALSVLALALDPLMAGPATQPATQPADQPANPRIWSIWSPPEQGVQLRFLAEQRTWCEDEIPRLRWEVRNLGPREHLTVVDGQRAAQLEVDGIWYQWPGGLRGGTLPDLGVGRSLEDQLLTLSPIWTEATTKELAWAGGMFGFDSKEVRHSLQLKPGTHTLRLGVIAKPSRANTGEGFRVVSPPLPIVVTPIPEPAGDKERPWPPGPKLAQALKEAIFTAGIVSQNSPRPAEPQMPQWIAEALAKAQRAAELAKGTPMETATKELVETLEAGQKSLASDPAAATPALHEVGRKFGTLVRTLSGELPPSPATQKK